MKIVLADSFIDQGWGGRGCWLIALLIRVGVVGVGIIRTKVDGIGVAGVVGYRRVLR